MKDFLIRNRRWSAVPRYLMCFVILISTISYNRYFHIIPFMDEIPYGISSLSGSVFDWIFDGYSEYFRMYDEWSTRSNFIRPVTNIIYNCAYHLSALMGGYPIFLSIYFGIFFIFLFSAAGLVRHSLGRAGVGAWGAEGLTTLFVFCPAVMTSALVIIPNQADIWVAALVLAAFVSLEHGHTCRAFLFLLIGVFTKEVALAASLAATITGWLTCRRAAPTLLLFSPILLWGLCYYFAFGGDTSAAAPLFNGPTGLLLVALKGALTWPLGVSQYSGLGDALWRGQINGLILLPALIGSLCNLLLWILLLSVALSLYRPTLQWFQSPTVGTADGSVDEGIRRSTRSFIWLACILAFNVMIAQGTPRYGATLNAFLLIAGATFFRHLPPLDFWSTRWIRHRLIIPALLSILLFATVYGGARQVADMWRMAEGKAPAYTQDGVPSDYGMLMALHKALTALSKDVSRVYVVGAPRQPGNPAYLPAAWGGPPDVVLVNGLTPCEHQDDGVSRDGGAIIVQLPACAAFNFVNVPEALLATTIGGQISRAGVGTYDFPRARRMGSSLTNPNRVLIDLGSTMIVRLAEGEKAVVLYYSLSKQEYRILLPNGTAG